MITTKKKVVRRSKKKAATAKATTKKKKIVTTATAKKKKVAPPLPPSSKKPLHQRRLTRRAKQFPEGTFDPQLMVPTMRFMCLRCGEFKHFVWNDVRRKYVQEHGGLPCENCGDNDPSDINTEN